jgi:NitT/TauT family transport system substrate-binding protein
MNKASLSGRLSLLVAMTALLLTSACAPPQAPALRVGINPWPGYEFLYLAQEKGFYRDQGFDLRLIEFNSLSDARRAFERGQIDAIAATVIEVLQVRDNSARSPQIVQVVDYSNGADVILARSGISNEAGLRGARIGLELASLGVFVLSRGLEQNALSLTDVKLVSMDQLSMENAYQNGELDAIVTYPPTSTKLLRNS